MIQFLREAKDWDRKATNVPGVFLLKLSSLKGRSASLAIEVNPIGTSGAVTKKRWVVVRPTNELEEINKLLSHPKLAELAKRLDHLNPEKLGANTGEKDVFEI